MKPSSKVISGKGKGSRSSPAAPVTSVRLSNSSNGPERTVDVRRIDNGFIVRESTYDPKKGYVSKERYSPKAPEIKVDGASMKPKGKC